MKSDAVKTGMQQAPHRSLFNALGMTAEEMKKPMVGIVSSYNEIVPGHMNLDKIVEAVKLGVAMAGGTPVVFPAIAVCDGIAMGHVGMKYSLVTRDLIADSTECMALAHQFDALVMVPNCDKNVPGLLMAAARINVPTVFVSGGPMLAGHVKGHKTSLSSMFEAVGSYAAGTMSEEDVREFEEKACPTCGSCSGMYTANSMNCLTEVLGMGLRGNGTIPAVYSERIKLAKHAGMQVMEMYRQNIRPRDIMTKEAFINALTMDMALGCSTNSMLHLPAIAHEAGVELNPDIANEISARTPNLCHLAPAGPTYIEDLNEAGGIYAVMNEISKKGLLNLDCMTVTGKTVGENIKGCANKNPDVIRPVENPYSQTGGIAILRGNLAPGSAVVKRSAVAPEMLQHARDAQSHLRHRGNGPGLHGGPDHRRPVLRRIQRRFHRPRVPGRPGGRPHRTGGRGRHHFHRHRQPQAGREGLRRGAGGQKGQMERPHAPGDQRIPGKVRLPGDQRGPRSSAGSEIEPARGGVTPPGPRTAAGSAIPAWTRAAAESVIPPGPRTAP